jgi:hypothetical protein
LNEILVGEGELLVVTRFVRFLFCSNSEREAIVSDVDGDDGDNDDNDDNDDVVIVEGIPVTFTLYHLVKLGAHSSLEVILLFGPSLIEA